ncbi:hydrogen dependent carbon dioxide reductase subunit HydA2 [Thermoanaerobacter kivui]|uniref:Hydrogen dependent carbon dioxide reductase subunit HydA2 n=2 Tax=Thermoanaerobacter kivui TaxID=2325 RepID=A0A097ATH7_THEKI|nr:[FeFe] hydrogenase, group A [Thermoanaerobacter kivui]7QV7_D Chain D, Hydrogen dependent carbon dioxide reductase subunit HydA2 [Thermoanaerobacter kivui]7QV7_K Chain K, Hydrogen dependent carbon dioxide reductase subunit HydA2 [Thermoanaerobacter kivui]7QV7_Q Chain Q, Hydrogen dependent carbon dioxide reductase subunit HydA2 [Thermoanaerobacter kivui]7QV7_R Chain R, Hydrogen dependent carbon dioxide reductase subunit HydA2 [Thermoanaerobacter kivui]7QV7_V Chain V, Hydrogen dependent carbon
MSANKAIINIDQELCTGCRRCAEVCPVDAIEGEKGKPQKINTEVCVMCGQCVQKCSSYASYFDESITPRNVKLQERGMLDSVKEPLFAAYNLGYARQVKEALENPQLFKVVQCAPAIRVSIAEEFGLDLGDLTPGKLVAALRRLNFDRVYDTNFGADLTIIEEANELVKRIKEGKDLPMFTSCCPAWVKFAEQTYPELLKHISTCKSPQQMTGAIIKTYGAKINNVDPAKIFSVSVMPCTCKSYESDRPEMRSSGYKDVDLVITTRELAHLMKDKGIDFATLPDEEFDSPLGNYTGAATIFGNTGGVMEAALRTAYELITKKPIPNIDIEFVRGGEGIRTATVQVGELELKIAVVSGLKNVIPILEDIKKNKCDLHFVEVMTCPEGCISGGGQPKLLLEEYREVAYKKRKEALYKHDAELELRKSHENPAIKKLYEEFLGEPLGKQSHHLLHTKYTPRKKV